MLFQPFGVAFAGDTMVILGGSLTQILFPFVFVGYFPCVIVSATLGLWAAVQPEPVVTPEHAERS